MGRGLPHLGLLF